MSGNPLEVVCEGLVNRRGEKKGENKGRVGGGGEMREKESADRLLIRVGLFLIVGSTPQLPHANKKNLTQTHTYVRTPH